MVLDQGHDGGMRMAYAFGIGDRRRHCAFELDQLKTLEAARFVGAQTEIISFRCEND